MESNSQVGHKRMSLEPDIRDMENTSSKFPDTNAAILGKKNREPNF